jgi:hypothetical protein
MTKIPPITNFLRFVECCTGAEIFFKGSLPIVSGEVYQYIGVTGYLGYGGSLIPGNCYTVYPEFVGGPTPYPGAPTMSVLSATDPDLDCQDPICPSCTPPIQNCYLIIPCDGSEPIISNNSDFEDYIESFITVVSIPFTGCAYVITLEDVNCEDAIPMYPDPDTPCGCDLQCYYVSNSNGFFYVDSTDTLINVPNLDANPYIQVCSKIPPLFENTDVDYQVINFGLCEDNQCETQCFKLTNCEDDTLIIYSTADSLIQYAYGTNNVVRIIGREGCWTVSPLGEGEVCDCPIDVTVTTSYIDCPTCLGVTAYKLTGCNNNDVIYTLDDLALYVNKVIKIDCGCYTVEQIDILPPNVQTVTVEDVYDTCIECTRIYWELLNCVRGQASIITYSDLSAYEGKVVKIEGCTECFTVKATNQHLNPALVTVSTVYDEGCSDCLNDLPCICSVLTNYTIEAKTYVYIDCNNIRTVITLQSGESSDRICVKYWDTVFESTDILETFGNCQNGLCPPPVFKNNRTVRPGYNTPICTPEKYDNITCRFADILYKIALEKRYGISNCCPEEDDRWLVQKELIDLQALKDPNYNCAECQCGCGPVNMCTTCNCKN